MNRDINITKVANRDGSYWSFESSKSIDEKKLPLVYGVTYRQGGFSSMPYNSLNLGLHVGDNKADVIANRERIARFLGVSRENITCANQVHGLNRVYIDETRKGQGALSIPKDLDCDAMFTDKVDVPLFLLVADCVPVLIYDSVHKVVAVVHAGWRGAIGHLPVLTLQTMQKKFGTQPQNCYVYLGPSIGPKSFEVSEDLAAKFMAEGELKKLELDKIVRYIQRKGSSQPTPHVDLWYFIAANLLLCGVPTNQITVTPTDTLEASQCFSYRREQGETGRIGLFAMLKA